MLPRPHTAELQHQWDNDIKWLHTAPRGQEIGSHSAAKHIRSAQQLLHYSLGNVPGCLSSPQTQDGSFCGPLPWKPVSLEDSVLWSPGWCGVAGTWKCRQAPEESQEEALHLEKPPSWWSRSRGLNLWAEMGQDLGAQGPMCTSHTHQRQPAPPAQSPHGAGPQWGPTPLDHYCIILLGEEAQHKKYHNPKTESIVNKEIMSVQLLLNLWLPISTISNNNNKILCF